MRRYPGGALSFFSQRNQTPGDGRELRGMTAKTLSTLTSLRILIPLILLLAVTAVFIRRRQMRTPEAKTAVAGIPTGTVTAVLLGIYFLIYLYLTFGFRRPAQAAQISLRPLWSYRAAFQLSPLKIRRLGLARQILLNILLTVPAGLLLPMLHHKSRHP